MKNLGVKYEIRARTKREIYQPTLDRMEKKKILAFIFPVIFFYTSMLFAAVGVGVFFHG